MGPSVAVGCSSMSPPRQVEGMAHRLRLQVDHTCIANWEEVGSPDSKALVLVQDNTDPSWKHK